MGGVTFNEGQDFQGGRVRKGAGRGTMVAGGGIGAVVIAVVATLLSGGSINPADLLSAFVGDGTSTSADGATDVETLGDCTVEQANTDRDCRLAATAYSLDEFWAKTLPAQAGTNYVEPGVVSFSGSVQTGCGSASAAMGPFYCPPDQTVYIDVSFYDELKSRFGASGGPLAEEYVIAHEFGHHIEQLSGAMDSANRSGSGPTSDSVRIELMADCLAGMWAGDASRTTYPPRTKPFLSPITDAQLKDALDAAASVGDDHIQQEATGRVSPEGFTHGTSEQRMRWFKTGYDGGTLATCNALEVKASDL